MDTDGRFRDDDEHGRRVADTTRGTMTSKPYPWYYAVNDRPVKIVELPDGGADMLVFDWSTGGFVPDRSYFGHVARHGNDVDQLDEAEFEARLRTLRRPILDKLYATPIAWEHTGDGEVPYRAAIGESTLTLRVNDFPAEPMYTLLVNGQEIEDLESWQSAWQRPEVPKHLVDLVSRTKKA